MLKNKWIITALTFTLVGGGAAAFINHSAAADTNQSSLENQLTDNDQETADDEANEDQDKEIADDQEQEDHDQELADDVEQAQLVKVAKITEQKSNEIALQQVKGEVLSAQLEEEDDVVVYNVIIQDGNGQEQEVKIDAKTGAVVKVEKADQEINDDKK